MSLHNFFGYSTIAIVTEFSFAATYFSSLVLVAGWVVCCYIKIFVATDLTWLISILFKFLLRQNSITLQLLLS